jgi:acetyl-CoA carboxylase biotin carboxyl carrier protein
MIDLDFLRELIRAVDESSVDTVELSQGMTRVRIAKSPAAVVAQAAPQPAAAAPPAAPPAERPAPAEEAPPTPSGGGKAARTDGLVEITSPMVGTFYRSPSPESPAYVQEGTRVSKGQTLCILEAMKLMNELEAEVAGVIREICVENAEPVEYGQVLFRIEPDA